MVLSKNWHINRISKQYIKFLLQFRLGEGRGRGFKVILCHGMSLAMHVKIIEAFKLEKDLDCQMGLFLPFGLDLLLENKNERNSIIYL